MVGGQGAVMAAVMFVYTMFVLVASAVVAVVLVQDWLREKVK